LLFLGFCLRIYRNRRPDQVARDARLAGDIGRKYKAMVVEVGNPPEGRTGEVYDDTKRYEYRLANGSVPHQAPPPPEAPPSQG
jgi:hypothetical protein